MPDLELQHRIRLALSWRAEARRLEQEARARFESGALEAGRFQHLQQRLAGEAETAQRALDGIRLRESETAARLGAHLRDCLGRKAAVAQQVKEGTIAHDTAAAEISRLDEEVKALRDAVGEFNRLLSADDVALLGGAIHARLEDYPVRLAAADFTGAASAQPWRRKLTWRQTRLVIICCAILIIGGAAALFMLNQNRSIDMVGSWSPEAPMEIALDCVYRGASEFLVYVPQPDEGAPLQQSAARVRVSQNGTPLKTGAAWTNDGHATQYTNPQRLLAGARLRFVLHLDRAPGYDPRAPVLIECVSPGGRLIESAEVAVGLP